MRFARSLFGVSSLAFLLAALAACGGSLNPNDGGTGGQGGNAGTTGTGGATTTVPCSALGACECLTASDRCTPRSEACWCPTECYPGAAIECVCGGGRFLACEEKDIVAVCASWLEAVQTKCAGQAFVGNIGALCDGPVNPLCVSNCLANLKEFGSCSEIDCSFCQACDCAAPSTPSPFAACVRGCALPLPE